ncbi:Clavaminate synthase-like protein [Ceratobasidium sp. AG-I]|nr:Clavaminate synthase-like protein [Ceratobasidium sp. AG-I]
MPNRIASALSPLQRDSLLSRLAQDYRDLNGSSVDVWTHTPSALEFARLVNVGRPVLFRNTPPQSDLPALTKWSNEYLVSSMGDRKVSVAITPDGRADALCALPDGTQCFAEPHTEHMTIHELLTAISQSEQDPSSEVYYLQSQNGNMYTASDFLSDVDAVEKSELEPLLDDVPKEVSWASEALDRTPDAVNVWIGGSRSVTSVHSDPYENIYAVVRGSKHFTLLPPTEGYTLHEQRVSHARYTRPIPTSPLQLSLVDPPATVRWAEVDPSLPSLDTKETGAMRITVREGESLYLPAGWWHHVAQTGDESGVCVAVNWWYDVEMRGMAWTWMSFLRRMGAPEGEIEEDSE